MIIVIIIMTIYHYHLISPPTPPALLVIGQARRTLVSEIEEILVTSKYWVQTP